MTSTSRQVKEGYYLYRKQVSITPAQASVGALQLPAGEWHEDEFYGKSEIYRQHLSVPVTVQQADKGATLTVTYRGCADAGFCYPQKPRSFRLVKLKRLPPTLLLFLQRSSVKVSLHQTSLSLRSGPC